MATTQIRPPVNLDDAEAVRELSERLSREPLEMRHVTKGVEDAGITRRRTTPDQNQFRRVWIMLRAWLRHQRDE